MRPLQLGIERTEQPRVYLELVVDLERNMMLAVDGRREVIQPRVLVCTRRGSSLRASGETRGEGVRTVNDLALLEEDAAVV